MSENKDRSGSYVHSQTGEPVCADHPYAIKKIPGITLGDILAAIHRDGGQYTAKHGLEKSFNDALNITYELIHYRERGEKMKKEIIFVYGTLKRGFGNHMLLSRKSTKFLGKATVKNHFLVALSAYIPGMSQCAQKKEKESKVWSYVSGELYEIDQETLKEVDVLEGFSENRSCNLYTRERIVATKENGEEISCWAYLYYESENAKVKLEEGATHGFLYGYDNSGVTVTLKEILI